MWRLSAFLSKIHSIIEFYYCSVITIRGLSAHSIELNLRKKATLLLRIFLYSCVLITASPLFGVEVVREGKIISSSSLNTVDDSNEDRSTQIYPNKRKSREFNSDTRVFSEKYGDNRDALATTENLSDFVDAPKDYERAISNKFDDNGESTTGIPDDATLPLEKVPLDKINQNFVPTNTNTESNNPQWEAVRQMGILQQEISELRGKLELQSQQISVMESQQKQRYLDLDSRLEALQGSMSISSTKQDAQQQDNSIDDHANKNEATSSAVSQSNSPQPSLSSSESAASVEMLKSYEEAQKLLKDKKLDSAKAAFKKLVQDYPEGNLTGDAYYWLGEIYLASQPVQESVAKKQFSKVVNEFSSSKKVPHALYKLALLEIRSGSKAQAKTLLLQLKKQHPSSPPAKLVDAQLKYLKENP